MLKRFAAAALLGTALSTTAMAQETGPIRSVTLSSGGLAEIVRQANVQDEGSIVIEVPLDQVNDVLKSLVVRDAAGKVKGIALAGPAPLEETFRTLPFSAEALGSLPLLLGSIQGTEVKATSGGKTVEGRVLGVETRADADGAAKPLLTVLGKDGEIATLWLSPDAHLKINDPAMRAKIAEAAAAAGKGKSDGSRAITVELGSGGDRQVDLSYVVAAPIWKTAYRVVIRNEGKARLQAWAVLENATGEDWDDVELTLQSSDPVTLKQKLHQRYWKDRAEVAIDTSAVHVPDADTGNLQPRLHARAAGDGMMPKTLEYAQALEPQEAVAADSAESLALAGMATTPEATESDISATFRLVGTYDVANGDTMSVPIIDSEVDAELVSVYRAGASSPHPVAAMMLENSSGVSLPGGILTVYDAANGYVGDAKLAGLPSGDSRMASFAADRKVSVLSESSPDRKITSLKVVDGVLHVTVKARDVTTYTVTGALDGDRTVVIEHPRREGWQFASEAHDGMTATHHRLKARVAAGTAQKLTAIHELLEEEMHALVHADPEMLAHWSSAATDEATAGKLKTLVEARRQQAEAGHRLQEAEEAIRQAGTAQERIRKNLAAVPETSDLHAKYLRMLEEREDRIAELEAVREEARKELSGHDERVAEAIRSF